MISLPEQSIIGIANDGERHDALASYLADVQIEKSWQFLVECLDDNFDVIQAEAIDFIIDNFDNVPENVVNAIYKKLKKESSVLLSARLWLAIAKFGEDTHKSTVLKINEENLSTYEKIYLIYSKYIITKKKIYKEKLYKIKNNQAEFSDLLDSIL